MKANKIVKVVLEFNEKKIREELIESYSENFSKKEARAIVKAMTTEEVIQWKQDGLQYLTQE